MVLSLIFTTCFSFKKGAVVSEQHYFGYCQIYVQAVVYVLDDQIINSEQVCGSIINLY